ncbi:carboxypeptidase M32 [Candidatus Woesearchaeota archaeon]|jgi:carboxypeptidase Taq|nr:carboxypeptidase M32 [Candidatus Woesearchaeota archaeon]MBT6518349.1 carboxypeptidase M32 [Candidatus Woesearchaeota archaeon]MBT7366646.1 carboxypeptidase M32 [Candidatus Woesearchaeota archaeon]
MVKLKINNQKINKTQLKKLLVELKKRETEITILKGMSALLQWDRATIMPKKALDERADQAAYLASKTHACVTDSKFYSLINKLYSAKSKLSRIDRLIVERYKKELVKLRKIPREHVEEYSRLTMKSAHHWEIAKSKKDFKIFKPYLEKVIAMKKKEAKFIDSRKKPYDVLFDEYEEGMTMNKINPVFDDLRDELKIVIKKIVSSKKYKQQKDKLSKLKFDFGAQEVCVNEMHDFIIPDQSRYYGAKSVHPFTTRISFNDIRITTTYKLNDPMYSLLSTAHEAGHALFELGMGKNLSGTILCDSPSYGLHESQSRIWENQIMRSRVFWKYYYSKYKKKFSALNKIKFEDFLLQVNQVKPSFIRVEADEVTYCMHVIIRYELEKKIFSGKLKVKDLPKEWNRMYKEYLGITPKNDTEGILQDVHWSEGYFGYFPTYAIGTMYSAMLFNQMKKEIKNFNGLISKGNFGPVREWLRKKIHDHGRTKSAEDIIVLACGRKLTHKDLIEYFKEKYYYLYEIN